jgi:hypothetical protein
VRERNSNGSIEELKKVAPLEEKAHEELIEKKRFS